MSQEQRLKEYLVKNGKAIECICATLPVGKWTTDCPAHATQSKPTK